MSPSITQSSLVFLFFLPALCLVAGGPSPQAAEVRLFDARTGTTWRNHVRIVPDPVGDAGDVLVAERVAKDRCQMTFVNDKGFFTMPKDSRGSVVLRLLVKGKGRIRVALVSGERIKSYYRTPPAESQWFEIELPLAEMEGKIPPGEPIRDITVWLLNPEGATTLDEDALLYLD
ncbi:MAG: hypothetical protein N2255_09640, partial [Kiritimatiellae bacterium]|nr:hypothetical protein [Kiritimatiellia bacterium]